jgi:hypothetical protein
MDERREEAKDSIRYYVWGGWHAPDEIYDIIDDEVFDCDGENDAWLRAAIEKEFSKKRKAENRWPAVTSFDRLDGAFEQLRRRGVLAAHRCGITQQDGLDVVDTLYDDAGGQNSGMVGYCFYTHQDMEGAMEDGGGMRLSFGSLSTNAGEGADVGRTAQQVLAASGFTVEWDGTVESRLLLRGFQWQRRSPND